MAQTYDPNHPVCLRVYAPEGGYIDCSFTSMPQCNATASGRGAQCYLNPYCATWAASTALAEGRICGDQAELTLRLAGCYSTAPRCRSASICSRAPPPKR